MAHHLVSLDLAFLSKLEHVLLIRDPREMLPSLINQIKGRASLFSCVTAKELMKQNKKGMELINLLINGMDCLVAQMGSAP